MSQLKRPSLAIIDDYLVTSASHFTKIPPSHLQIITFKDTIIPVNEVETARLVERLRPFDAISTIRERTAFLAHFFASSPT
ncbi:hypothetical protein IFR04_005847 [Cadophora malorum]|uniref:Uncharacterized protein n=1 Tax=Cadophora malorum TaxID=108018 RepID=A0A8H7TLC1_9HELO|nr:hypothetical protein IFR04_005847 [Cadophora malorum]